MPGEVMQHRGRQNIDVIVTIELGKQMPKDRCKRFDVGRKMSNIPSKTAIEKTPIEGLCENFAHDVVWHGQIDLRAR